jgi:hypothetical protein
MKTKKPLSEEELLTKSEKIDKLIELMGSKILEVGRLLLPDTDLYGELDKSNVDIEKCGKFIQNWLAIKKRIRYTFSDGVPDSSYNIVDGSYTISVNRAFAANALRVSALLSHELMHYLINENLAYRLTDPSQNEELIDLATIYSGLGVVVVNGLGQHDGWWQNIRHRKLRKRISLGYYSDQQYAQEFLGYAHRYNLDIESASQYMMPWTRTFAPKPISLAQKDKLRQSDPVNHMQQRLREQNTKSFLIALAVTVLVSSMSFALLNKPQSLTKAEAEQYDKVQLLKRMYEVCRQAQKTQQDTLDTSNFFLERTVNATGTRCESIRNQYNYEVNNFNEKINKK